MPFPVQLIPSPVGFLLGPSGRFPRIFLTSPFRINCGFRPDPPRVFKRNLCWSRSRHALEMAKGGAPADNAVLLARHFHQKQTPASVFWVNL